MKDSVIKDAFAPWKSTPQVAPAVETSVEASATKVTARLNYTSVGVCPYCNQPTTTVECCGQKVFLCEQDRFVAPLPNSEQG